MTPQITVERRADVGIGLRYALGVVLESFHDDEIEGDAITVT